MRPKSKEYKKLERKNKKQVRRNRDKLEMIGDNKVVYGYHGKIFF